MGGSVTSQGEVGFRLGSGRRLAEAMLVMIGTQGGLAESQALCLPG